MFRVGSEPLYVYLGFIYCSVAEKERNKKPLKYKKQRSGAAEKQTNEKTEKPTKHKNKNKQVGRETKAKAIATIHEKQKAKTKLKRTRPYKNDCSL